MPCYSPLTLGTERLHLQALTPADAPAVFGICSDATVMRYGSSPPWGELQTALDAIERDRQAVAEGRSVCLGLFRRTDELLLGTCTLFHIDLQCRRAEIGYVLGVFAWGQGYATEALTALLTHGFGEMNLNRVEADVDPLNARSVRALQRQGFVREGLLRERWIVSGQKSDSALYGLLAADFQMRWR